MNRDQLSTGLSQIKTKIKELKKLRFKYFIRGKYINGYGQLELIEDPETLMKAFSFVKKQFETEEVSDNLASELGFTTVELPEVEESLFLGYTLEEWTEEFRMKASEIQTNVQIEQLEKAKEKFKSYRTEDEKFADDANKFSALFGALGIGVSEEKWEDMPGSDDSPKLVE